MGDVDVDIDEEAVLSISHFIAGALAGTAEHTGMYPIDTIKTNIQAQIGTRSPTVLETTREIWTRGGVRGFFRGITAIIGGAAPAHAVYFSTLEYCKQMGLATGTAAPLVFAWAGATATILQDAIMTPMDTIKQRRQLGVTNYTSTWHCYRSVVRAEGYGALYAGYSTTLLMNVPFHAIYLNFYELFKGYFVKENHNTFSVKDHILAGGGAGIAAAALTNPFDVTKTRLQTQGEMGQKYRGMVDAFSSILRDDGVAGFARGISARMLFHCFSAGILWSTYEYGKYILGAPQL